MLVPQEHPATSTCVYVQMQGKKKIHGFFERPVVPFVLERKYRLLVYLPDFSYRIKIMRKFFALSFKYTLQTFI